MKILIILPYFGKFNSYFPLWLKSVKYNSDIDFLIITDNNWHWDTYDNVKVINITFEELKEQFENKFGIKIELKRPYKLCDYKPYYGFLFSEYLLDYDFWGYCDCDLIFGRIRSFISDDLLLKYDKLLRTGHLTFVRNTHDINNNFLKYDTYKMVIKSPAIYGYDESKFGYHNGFAGELMESGYCFYENESIVGDVDYRHYPFRIVTDPLKCCVFCFQEGKIFRIDKSDNGITTTELMYVHLQKRHMEVSIDINDDNYLIRPNCFRPINDEELYSESFWNEVSKEQNGYFSQKKEWLRNQKRDLLRLIYEPNKLKSLTYRFTGKK